MLCCMLVGVLPVMKSADLTPHASPALGALFTRFCAACWCDASWGMVPDISFGRDRGRVGVQLNGLKLSNSWEGFYILLNPDFSASIQWRFVNRAIDEAGA